MKRVIMVCAVCVAMMLLVPTASAQLNTGSKLQQQIGPLGCSHTTVETGLGTAHDSTCPPFKPTITTFQANGGRPIITGIYDAVHTEKLRVQIAGLRYVLGESPWLTVNGNVWVLDLSALVSPLEAGEYSLIVEATGDNGEFWQVEKVVTMLPGQESGGGIARLPEVEASVNQQASSTDPSDKAEPSSPDPAREDDTMPGSSIVSEAPNILLSPLFKVLFIILWLLLLFCLFLLLFRRRRKYRGQ